MKNYILLILIAIICISCDDGIPQEEKENAWWLDKADLTAMKQDWSAPHANFSCDSNDLSIAGKSYDRGVGTHAISKLLINVNGSGDRIKGAAPSRA